MIIWRCPMVQHRDAAKRVTRWFGNCSATAQNMSNNVSAYAWSYELCVGRVCLFSRPPISNIPSKDFHSPPPQNRFLRPKWKLYLGRHFGGKNSEVFFLSLCAVLQKHFDGRGLFRCGGRGGKKVGDMKRSRGRKKKQRKLCCFFLSFQAPPKKLEFTSFKTLPTIFVDLLYPRQIWGGRGGW